jgi:methanogenic corrinoid protein MtbC1
LWRDVGADFCARDAREAVAIANRLVKDADGGEA